MIKSEPFCEQILQLIIEGKLSPLTNCEAEYVARVLNRFTFYENEVEVLERKRPNDSSAIEKLKEKRWEDVFELINIFSHGALPKGKLYLLTYEEVKVLFLQLITIYESTIQRAFSKVMEGMKNG